MIEDEELAVHLAVTGIPELDAAVQWFESLATHSTRVHLTANPSEAHLIIFTQSHLCADPLRMPELRDSLMWRQHRDRCYVIDWRDRPWCAFPGLYASMPRRTFDARWQRAWLYPWITDTDLIPLRPQEPDLLFSFAGARTHPIRAEILAVRHPRAVVRETTPPGSPGADGPEYRRRYAEELARSRFVLCPRGHGTASFRLQETLAAGRVPVVISDDWVPPTGPEWGATIITCRERDMDRLPSRLEGLEHRYEELSRAASLLYDRWFRREVMFDRMVDQLLSITRNDRRSFPGRGLRGTRYWSLKAAALAARQG